MKTVFGIIGCIVLFFGAIWLVQGNDFFMYKVFAPKYEDVRRNVFENTKSYNQGMIQELQNMQFEYVKADKAGKDVMASVILHRVADFDTNKLPNDLAVFISSLKRERIQ